MNPRVTDSGRIDRRLDVVLVLEQALGHRVHGAHLARMAAEQPDMAPRVIPISHRQRRWAGGLPWAGTWSFEASRATRSALRSSMRARPPDVVYIHTQVAALFVAETMRTVPTVVSLDATPLNYDRIGGAYEHHRQSAPIERVKFTLNRRALQMSRAVVTFSNWAAASVVTDYGISEERVHVIPSGVDLRRFHHQERPPHGGSTRILFVGGDFHRKGGDDLLDALERIDDHVELDLVTSVSPPSVPRGVTARTHTGLGPDSPELVSLFGRADIFAFPSHGDCSPRVVAEAMASGLPVVACGVGGIPEMVVDGANGLLVPVGSPGALADSLRRLIRRPDERRSMGIAGRAEAARHHDAAQNAERLFDLLRRCSNARQEWFPRGRRPVRAR